MDGYDFWVKQTLVTRNLILDYLRYSERSDEADALLTRKGKEEIQTKRDEFFKPIK